MKRQIAHSMSFDFKLLYSLNTQMFDTFKLQIPVLLKWLTLVCQNRRWVGILGILHCTNTDTNTETNTVSNTDQYSYKYRDKQVQVQIQFVTMTRGGWDNGKTWNRSKFDAKPADLCRIKQGCLGTWVHSVIIFFAQGSFIHWQGPFMQVVLSCIGDVVAI